MACRNISEEEVYAILQEGSVNFQKSKVHEAPCPSYAIEGKSIDGQNIRVVFAKCDSISKVITTIDLNQKHDCDCK